MYSQAPIDLSFSKFFSSQICCFVNFYSETTVGLKGYIVEKIDLQELIFAIVNWPNSELYGTFVCTYNALLGQVCYLQAY